MAPRIWKNIRPTAVEVSIPWSSTTRSGAVTVLGEPGELVLFAFGRDAVRVELQGEPGDVEALKAAPRGV